MDPIMIFLRLVVPLVIFRFPLVGGLASLWLDGADWQANFFHIANLHAHYRQIDKSLDFYYYSIEAYTVLWWPKGWARTTALGLYLWRGIGTFFFVLTQDAFLPIIFPNLFEGFFLLYLLCRLILGRYPAFSKKLTLLVVGVLAAPKLFQEYLMHVTNPWDWRYVRFILPGGSTFIYDNVNHQIWIAVMLIAGVCLFLTLQKSQKKRGKLSHRR